MFCLWKPVRFHLSLAAQIEEKRIKYKMELESKRMQREQMRRKSEQEHELRLVQMCLFHQNRIDFYNFPWRRICFTGVQSGNPMVSEMAGADQLNAEQTVFPRVV